MVAWVEEITDWEIAEGKSLRLHGWLKPYADSSYLWSCYSDAERALIEDYRSKLVGYQNRLWFGVQAYVGVDFERNPDRDIFAYMEILSRFRPEGGWTLRKVTATTSEFRFSRENDAMLLRMLQ